MPNIAAMFKSEITRLARREIRVEIDPIKKSLSAYKADNVLLKQQVRALQAELKQVARRSKPAPVAAAVEGDDVQLRFRPAGMKSHRQKLGLSAKDYGLLVGASALSVYKWEEGKVKPRPSALTKIAAVRKLGKREATRRLESLSAA